MVTFDEEKQKKKLAELKQEEEEGLAQLLSQKYEIPYADLSTVSINSDALRLIPEEKAREAKMAAFRLVGKKVYIAIASPGNKNVAAVAQELEKMGYILFFSVASNRSLLRAFERYKELSFAEKTPVGIIEISEAAILSYTQKVKTLGGVIALITETLGSKKKFQTSTLLEIFIAGALATEASDIHIEPEEANVRLRFRLDGVLQDLLFFEHAVNKLLNSRIKLVSGLKLNIRDQAQDGRFSIQFGKTEIEVRTSVVPGAYGESIVLRILNPNTIGVPLEELGIEPALLEILEHEIKKPNGMILSTGPTGSGKTTTLYAFLKKIQTPGIKILTIEDPIEYHLAGITQTQLDAEKDYTFVSGLRSGLRQDPDVIMVGEIRDEETAKTAVNAALTGHLVLSTLHTNNAAGAIPRLIDLKVNPKIISSALSVSIAQRLVRRLCKWCKVKSAPHADEKKLIERVLQTMPRKEKLNTTLIWRPGKCEKCSNTGYKGRIGIFEAIRMDENVERVTIQNPSEREIRHAAREQGILDMGQDGIIKVLQGITSLEELARVIDIEEGR